MPKRSLKKRKDGRYLCWYKGVPFYGHASDEALEARDEYKRSIKSGLREEGLGITFHQYAEEWIQTYKQGVSMKTYNDYVRHLNVACKSIGDNRMKDIMPTDVMKLFNDQRGRSQSYMHKYVITLKSIFTAAVNDGIILRNPCARIKPPAGPSGTHRALEQWERDLISVMVEKYEMAVAAMLMLYAGLRRGEALAFDVDQDVDFYMGMIFVRRAVVYYSNQPITKSPKSKAGVREIYLFTPLRQALEGMHGLVLNKSVVA